MLEEVPGESDAGGILWGSHPLIKSATTALDPSAALTRWKLGVRLNCLVHHRVARARHADAPAGDAT